MPRVSWMKQVKQPKAEDVDLLMAVIRYQRCAMKLSFDELGKRTGYSAGHLKNIFNELEKSPWEWPTETRNTICDALGIGKELRQQCYRG